MELYSEIDPKKEEAKEDIIAEIKEPDSSGWLIACFFNIMDRDCYSIWIRTDETF